MNPALLLLLLWLAGCGVDAPMPLELDPGLGELALTELRPTLVLPGTELIVSARALPSPGDGAISLRLTGTFYGERTAARPIDLRLRARYESAARARVPIGAEIFSATGATAGILEGQAVLQVDSAIDLRAYRTDPQPVHLEIQRVLSPRLRSAELHGAAQGSGLVHPNDWLVLRGEGMLLGGGEGQTSAVLDGCFLPEGQSGDCSLIGRRVVRAEVPVRSPDPSDRTLGVIPWAPTIHGVQPGRFFGTIALKNAQPSLSAPTRSSALPLRLQQLRPELRAFSPSAASLGQYVAIAGSGFIGGQPGQATLVHLSGTFTAEGDPRPAPVELDIVIEYLPRFPSGPGGRYVLDEGDALGQALLPRGGLRKAAGRFEGTATPVLHHGKDLITGSGARVQLQLLHVRQVVQVRFLPSYLDTLRLFGLRAADNAVRARVLEVARRDYAGVNIDFRADRPGIDSSDDFALSSVVEIGGADPNGLGLLGYDNTPGRDMGNRRLYDRIGGVNAVTQEDGSPGFGGVFAEQFLGFSAAPGRVERLPAPEEDSRLFDRVFDPLRPEQGGTAARAAELGSLPALADSSGCPAPADNRPRQVACAVFVLGTLIGNTMTHELGHSLGLANPRTPTGSYHDNGKIPGRIMNPGSLRGLRERGEFGGGKPAVFCDSEYQYLREILPGAADAPPPLSRPPCNERP